MRHHAIGLCFMLVTGALAAPAFADVTSDACVDANARAQALRRDGKLAAARGQLAACVDRRCPGIVRDDCAKRLDELNRAQPTIVFDAEDGAGHDVVAVAVSVDGRPLTDKLDGSPLTVDPGPHAFRFEVAGHPAITRTFVLKEGEKGRLEHVALGPPAGDGPGGGAGAAAREAPAADVVPPPREAKVPAAAIDGRGLEAGAPPASEGHGLSGGQITGVVFTVLGVGGLATGTAYGLLASSAWDRSKRECPTSCAEPSHGQAVADRSTAVTDGTVSTIGFIAGGALAAAGVTLIVAAHPARGPASGAGLRVTPLMGAGTAGLGLQGEF